MSTAAPPLVDLRSDTVTRPTPAMRQAMMDAPLGDDVFGDDPTVNALQARIAAITGKEAALFMPSGTQSNFCGILAHCGRGDEYIVGQLAHTYRYEGGGAAVLGSVQPQPLAQDAAGRMQLADIAAAIKPDDPHFARTRLLCLENTWNGHVMPDDYLQGAVALARERGLATHLDGARLFNAAVASARPGQGALARAGEIAAMVVEVTKRIFTRPFQFRQSKACIFPAKRQEGVNSFTWNGMGNRSVCTSYSAPCGGSVSSSILIFSFCPAGNRFSSPSGTPISSRLTRVLPLIKAESIAVSVRFTFRSTSKAKPKLANSALTASKCDDRSKSGLAFSREKSRSSE